MVYQCQLIVLRNRSILCTFWMVNELYTFESHQWNHYGIVVSQCTQLLQPAEPSRSVGSGQDFRTSSLQVKLPGLSAWLNLSEN